MAHSFKLGCGLLHQMRSLEPLFDSCTPCCARDALNDAGFRGQASNVPPPHFIETATLQPVQR